MELLEITSSDQLWSWFAENHAAIKSVRLVTWKAAYTDRYVSQEEVLDALIAHGWIDGRRFVVDDARTAQLIAPRKQQAWSKTYKDRVELLRNAGRMHPAGEAAVSESGKSELWNFFDDVDALSVPEDLSAILDHEKWKELAPSYRRNVLRWIKLAKKPTTRRNRSTAAADATRLNKKLPQM